MKQVAADLKMRLVFSSRAIHAGEDGERFFRTLNEIFLRLGREEPAQPAGCPAYP